MTGCDGMRNQAVAQLVGFAPHGADTRERREACLLGREWGWLRSNGCRKLRSLQPVSCGDVHLLLLKLADGGSGENEDA